MSALYIKAEELGLRVSQEINREQPGQNSGDTYNDLLVTSVNRDELVHSQLLLVNNMLVNTTIEKDHLYIKDLKNKFKMTDGYLDAGLIDLSKHKPITKFTHTYVQMSGSRVTIGHPSGMIPDLVCLGGSLYTPDTITSTNVVIDLDKTPYKERLMKTLKYFDYEAMGLVVSNDGDTISGFYEATFVSNLIFSDISFFIAADGGLTMKTEGELRSRLPRKFVTSLPDLKPIVDVNGVLNNYFTEITPEDEQRVVRISTKNNMRSGGYRYDGKHNVESNLVMGNHEEVDTHKGYIAYWLDIS